MINYCFHETRYLKAISFTELEIVRFHKTRDYLNEIVEFSPEGKKLWGFPHKGRDSGPSLCTELHVVVVVV